MDHFTNFAPWVATALSVLYNVHLRVKIYNNGRPSVNGKYVRQEVCSEVVRNFRESIQRLEKIQDNIFNKLSDLDIYLRNGGGRK